MDIFLHEGQSVYQHSTVNTAGCIDIDTSNWPLGMYALRLHTNNNNWLLRCFIEE